MPQVMETRGQLNCLCGFGKPVLHGKEMHETHDGRCSRCGRDGSPKCLGFQPVVEEQELD